MPGPDRRAFLAGGALAGAAVTAAGRATAAEADPPAGDVFELWPGGPPGAAGVRVTQLVTERPNPQGLRDRIVTGITRPTLTLFRPARPDGSVVVLVPGGGYERVVVDKEGFETARLLASRGVTAFVLLYRLPADGWAAGPDAPLQDAQRGVRLTRSLAPRFGGDPARVGVMGFSAGGHVAASLLGRFDAPIYAPVDAVDALSARPDFAGLVYPVITMEAGPAHPGSRARLLGPDPSEALVRAYSADAGARADAPPTFLLHAVDDASVPVDNSLRMLAALRRAGAPVEAHLFEEGGHGFGLRTIAGKPVEAWPDLWLRWRRRRGYFKT